MAKHNALDGLIKWSQREDWGDLFGEVLDAHFGDVCEDHAVDFEKLPDLIGEQSFGALWGCAFEDFLTQPRSEEDEQTIVDDYLKRRGWKESVTNRRYMEALRDSLMSLYEVSEIAPGQSMLLRDLVLGGDPVRVVEHSATHGLKPRDRIGARVVNVSGQDRISGGLLLFQPEAAAMLLDELQADMKKFRREFESQARAAGFEETGLTDAEAADLAYLMGAASMFTGVWLDHDLSRLLGNARPALLNADGDELSFHTARYPFGPGVASETLRARLNGVPDLVAAGENVWNWVEEPASAPVGKGSATAQGPFGSVTGVDPDDGPKVLGSVELQPEALVMETNSSRRAALGSDMLKAALGALIGKSQTTVRGLEDMREQASGAPAGTVDRGLSPEEQAEAIGRVLDSHYRAALDQPLPMLDGLTPRAAAKSKSGQRKLVEWLKYLENRTTNAGTGGAAYDFGWMWDELGIAQLRK